MVAVIVSIIFTGRPARRRKTENLKNIEEENMGTAEIGAK